MAKVLDKNYIVYEVKIDKQDINKKINLLGISPKSITKDPQIYQFINASNSKIYIDNKKIENFSLKQEFPNPGTFQIKIEISEFLSDLSFIFFLCKYISKVDLSHLNMENISSMESAFSGCSNLIEINLGNVNSDKITNLFGTFYECSN